MSRDVDLSSLEVAVNKPNKYEDLPSVPVYRKEDIDGAVATVDATWESALHIAYNKGDIGSATALCEQKASSANWTGYSSLHLACEYGFLECVIYLIEKGAPINTVDFMGRTPLHLACDRSDKNYRDCVAYLLNQKALILLDSNKQSPVHQACISDSEDCLALLIKQKACINEYDLDWLTPMHWACIEGGSKNCLVLLIEQKDRIDINVLDSHRRTPLHFACKYGLLSCVVVLVKYGARFDIPNTDGNSALYMACIYGHTACVTVLFECLTSVQTPNIPPAIPLDIAFRGSYPKLVFYLLNIGINTDVLYKDKQTFLELIDQGNSSGNLEYALKTTRVLLAHEKRSQEIKRTKLIVEYWSRKFGVYPSNSVVVMIIDFRSFQLLKLGAIHNRLRTLSERLRLEKLASL